MMRTYKDEVSAGSASVYVWESGDRAYMTAAHVLLFVGYGNGNKHKDSKEIYAIRRNGRQI